jgi:hypothetical protein
MVIPRRPSLPAPARILLAAALMLLALGACAPRARAAAPPLAGVQLHALWSDRTPADVARELDLARGAGANVVRVDVGWASLEPAGKGQLSAWYVKRLDGFMDGASARGLKVIATVFGTPCWASTAPESRRQGCEGAWWDRDVSYYPPADPADYGAIARWMTSRYGARLAALEVWNEPNLGGGRFWHSPRPAADYARLLRAAYPAAKAGDADVPVLAASLAGADRSFLSRLYAAGIRGSYDGLAIHPYGESRAGTRSIHAAQVAAGDRTPLWITEFGWTSCRGSGSCVSERRQADNTARAFGVFARMPYVRAATAYDLREDGTDPSEAEDNFGLVNQDFSPKPAYAAVRAVLTRAATARARARAARRTRNSRRRAV